MSEEEPAEHLLQKHGVLAEFDIISSTSLEEFMETYERVVNTPDDINELAKVSSLLQRNDIEVPGFIIPDEHKSRKHNPELDKIAFTLIEFIMKKTVDPQDWAYILTYVIDKLGLEFDDDDQDPEE
jgi:hypothetical protein